MSPRGRMKTWSADAGSTQQERGLTITQCCLRPPTALGVSDYPERSRGAAYSPHQRKRACQESAATRMRKRHLCIACQIGKKKQGEENNTQCCNDRDEISLLCRASGDRHQRSLGRDPFSRKLSLACSFLLRFHPEQLSDLQGLSRWFSGQPSLGEQKIC